jgi:hypothetical protein
MNEKQFTQIVKKITKQFLGSNEMRTYNVKGDWDTTKSYVLDFEEVTEDGHELKCTTWGFDYANIPVPATYDELAKSKIRAELGMLDTGLPAEVTSRYYYEIMHACNE